MVTYNISDFMERSLIKVYHMIYISDAEPGGPGGPLSPSPLSQYFSDQLTLFEPERADYPHYWHPQSSSPSGITVYVDIIMTEKKNY